jgi:hypothetical protein
MPIAALVLGIVGLVLSLIPCLGMYALPLTLLAIILGALGMKDAAGRGLAIAGLACGIIGTCAAAWWLYAFMSLKGAGEEGLKQFEKDFKAATEKMEKDLEKDLNKAVEAAPTPAPAPEAPAPAAATP